MILLSKARDQDKTKLAILSTHLYAIVDTYMNAWTSKCTFQKFQEVWISSYVFQVTVFSPLYLQEFQIFHIFLM